MKNNLFAILSSVVLGVGFFTNASSQSFASADLARVSVPANSSVSKSKNMAAISSKAGSKAFKKFSTQFKAVDDAEWMASANGGFTVYFKNEASPAHAFYNQHGQFEYSVTRHCAANIPGEIVKNVKNAFDGYRIICAEEIFAYDQHIFLVHIQSFTCSKTLRVTADEMEVIEELFNS